MKKTLAFALIAVLPMLGACSDDCEDAESRIEAKYDSCGVTLDPAPSEPDDDFECTEEIGNSSQCTADCIDAAACGALDGTDADASLNLVTCFGDCV